MAKRKVASVARLTGDSKAFFDILEEVSDLGVAVIGASFLDQCLGSFLESHLIKSAVSSRLLEPPGGLLSSLSTRADAAYAFDLLPKADFQDIELIAQIRNLFAHNHIQVTFTDPEVVELCGRLSRHQPLVVALVKENGEMAARELFGATVVAISQILLSRSRMRRGRRGDGGA